MRCVDVLLVNAGLQVLASSLLGFVMLAGLQPWTPHWLQRLPPPKAFLPVHLDLYMLAFMQGLAAVGCAHFGTPAGAAVAVVLLVAGGWLNASPYAFRLIKVNAFVLSTARGTLPWLAAMISLLSSLGIVAAWTILLSGWLAL